MEKVYQAVESAKKSGKICKGANEVTKALEKGEAKFVTYAKDVSPKEIVMHLPILAEEKGIPCLEVESKKELGASAGLPVGTTAVAILDEGKAKGLIKEVSNTK